MNFIKHPKHTRFIGKPLSWDERRDGPCGALSVCDKVANGYQVMESLWLPTPEEALAMATGYGSIQLGVYGNIHPVVYMGVMPDTPPDREAYRAGLQRAFEWLVAMAESGGLKVDITTLGIGPDARSEVQISEKRS